MDIVQIDHTAVDVVLIDDEYRLPIGRPWVTLAIDAYSRMITGYYVSFDPPSETSVALCVAHSICSKDEWLLLHDVDAEWPVWGTPDTIHADRYEEFSLSVFQHSCVTHNINLEFTYVKQPRYGHHIRRLLGSFVLQDNLPGTTFSSVEDITCSGPDNQSVMTKSEFDTWLAKYICSVYHKSVHVDLGTTPLRQLEIGVFGNAAIVCSGLPPKPNDRFTFSLDFMPYVMCTVDPHGVTHDDFIYYDDVLLPWVNATDFEQPSTRRKFMFRYDPSDLRQLWFFAPNVGHYLKIPLSDVTVDPISIWQLRLAKEHVETGDKQSTTQRDIFQSIAVLRNHAKVSNSERQHTMSIVKEHPSNDLIDGHIEPFGDIS